MDSWQGWATAFFGFILTILGTNYRLDKTRQDSHNREATERERTLTERVVKLESSTMTESEVRAILKEYLDPLRETLPQLQQDIQEIKLDLAKLPKRQEDE